MLALVVDITNAECCHPNGAFGACNDGTKGTPYCGKGTCDMFGCNCAGNWDIIQDSTMISTNWFVVIFFKCSGGCR